MIWLKRIAVGAGVLLLLALLVLVGSIVTDGLVGEGRVAALSNTQIPQLEGPAVSAYVARPDGAGPFPAVIMIHEWWGLQSEIVGKAEALADEGYVVIAPDTYRGASTQWIPRALYQSIRTPQPRVDQDLDAVYRWLTQQTDVDADRIAIMGFCYGGGKSLRYSLHNEEIAGTVVFYGSPISDPAVLQELPAPLLGIFGTADQQIPVEEVRAFDAALEEAGVPHQVTLYEGQPHAFVGSIEEVRQGGAEGEAWSELLAFLDSTLR